MLWRSWRPLRLQPNPLPRSTALPAPAALEDDIADDFDTEILIEIILFREDHRCIFIPKMTGDVDVRLAGVSEEIRNIVLGMGIELGADERLSLFMLVVISGMENGIDG